MTLKIGALTKLGLFPVVCFIHVSHVFDQTLAEQLYRDKDLLYLLAKVLTITRFYREHVQISNGVDRKKTALCLLVCLKENCRERHKGVSCPLC